MISVALTLCLALLAASVHADDGALRGWRLPMPALHAEPDLAGGRIVDARGREVLLRGVNVNALAEYWPYGAFATTFPFEDADAARIAAIGWNVVRLLVSWSRVEPAPDVYDDAYLREVERIARRLARHNVYTIIDFHQDAWGPTLAAPPGATCAPPNEPAFGWDGAPGWATLDGGAPRCFVLTRELSQAVLAAFAAFFANAPGPGGVGIQTRYVAMLRHTAERFAAMKTVVGYDLMNEPNALSAAQIASLATLYADAVPAIRAGEAAARRGFRHLVLFEPSALWSDFGSGNVAAFSDDDGIVFSPHIYRGGISAGPIPRADFERARADAAVHGGAPVLVGEWGNDPRRAADPVDVYFRQHQAWQDEFRFSATLWTWRESCGDPHKAGDVRAGRVPYVWGEFEVDCTTNTVTGPRQALVDQLTRGWVRAAPGRLAATAWDPTTGVLTASGSAARQGTRLVAFWPARLHGAPRLEGAGLRRLRTRAAWGGLYVLGNATGGAWSLVVRPESGGSPSGAFLAD
jgi:endoglycosylceramidase